MLARLYWVQTDRGDRADGMTPSPTSQTGSMLAVVEGSAALALYESTAEVWSGAKRRGTLGGGRWLAEVAGVERTTVSCESDAALVASGGASQGRLPCKSAQWLVIYRGARCDD